MAKPTPIPSPEGKFEPIEHGDRGLQTFIDAANKRFIDIEQLTKAILFVALIALVSVIVAVVGLVLDQMHFNNQTYRQQASDNQAQIRLLQDEINVVQGQLDKNKTVQQTAQ